MNTGLYGDLIDFSEDVDSYQEYDPSEIDDMLDGLMDASSDDYGEKKKPKKQPKPKKKPAKPVPTAQGQSAYRPPAGANGYVTQKQLQDALARVGTDVQRNAAGITTINGRLTALDSRVDGVVSVNTTQSQAIGKLHRQMRMTGALEISQALVPGGLNAFQLLKGAAASGVLPDNGALSNPWLIGGLGLLLQNSGILGGLTGALSGQQPTTPQA